MDNVKPQVFIASSVEGLRVAEAINSNLDRIANTHLWHSGTFKLGSNSLDELVKKSSQIDFAVFVFTPDDLLTIKDKTTHTVRDNVVFELGLFIGALGKTRCYIVQPRGIELHLPSDLLGVTTASYNSERPPNETASALNSACSEIKGEIESHGLILREGHRTGGVTKAHVPNPAEYVLNAVDIEFLGECVVSSAAHPRGLSFASIDNSLRRLSSAIGLSAVKLCRLGYVEKTLEDSGNYGDEYYVYSVTESGLDGYIRSEKLVLPPSKEQRVAPNFSDMDDNIPF